MIFGIVFVLYLIFTAIERKRTANTGALQITITDFERVHFVTPEEIRKTIIDSIGNDLSGIPAHSIHLGKVEAIIRLNPYVKNAEVFLDASNHINVKLTQREAILRVIDMGDVGYYIDTEGVQFPLSRHGTARVPIATGFIGAGIQCKDLKKVDCPLHPLLVLMEFIRSNPMWDADIEQIYVDKYGEFTLVPKLGEANIIIGEATHLPEKFHRLEQFYAEAMPYEGWTRYKTINVKYEGQVVCSKE